MTVGMPVSGRLTISVTLRRTAALTAFVLAAMGLSGGLADGSPAMAPGASGPLGSTNIRGLRAVAAVSSTDAWAVGRVGGRIGPEIGHWDGNTWTRADAPEIGGG
jgi:hypothetical protein